MTTFHIDQRHITNVNAEERQETTTLVIVAANVAILTLILILSI